MKPTHEHSQTVADPDIWLGFASPAPSGSATALRPAMAKEKVFVIAIR